MARRTSLRGDSVLPRSYMGAIAPGRAEQRVIRFKLGRYTVSWNFGKDPISGKQRPNDGKTNGLRRSSDAHRAFDNVTSEDGLDSPYRSRPPRTDFAGSDSKDYAALVGAVYAGHVKALGRLLDEGSDVNSSNHLGFTVLMLAAAGDMADMVELLLERGADPDASDISGRTALMWAAEEGSVETVSVLVGKSANVNAQDRSGQTALILACRNGRQGVLKTLLESGADRAVRDNCGDTALTWAEAKGFPELLK